MRKARVWLILTVTALVLVAGVLIGLPDILRRVAISRLHALTGRPVTIGDVDVNLFTRTLAVENLRIAGGAGPPLAGIQRLEAHAILERRGQAVPFIRHPRLEGTITDLWLRDGAVALGRLALSGSPTIVDHRDATGAPRRDIPLAHGGGRGLACGKPARVEGAATLDRGGTATLAGTVHSVTLATDVRVTFADLDLARLRPYVPADAPATLARARGARALTYGRSAGVHIDGNATVADIAVSRAGAEPLVRALALKIAVRDLAIKDAAVSAGSMTLAGAPSIVDTRVSPPAPWVCAPRA